MDQQQRSHEADPQIRSILITGGAGFIGSHVTRALVRHYPEYKIVNFDRLDYCSSPKNTVDLNQFPNYKFIKGDVTSGDFVKYVLRENEIDIIMHFAALSHVDNSFGDSFAFTTSNVMGTHVLLEAARVHGIKKFIHVSTDEVYGEVPLGARCDENSVLAPSNPYSATKAAAECLVNAYYKSFNLPVIITRSNNIYGPCQFPEKIIPKFICSLLNDRKCFIHGDGKNSRHYLYATDLAEAMIAILHKGAIGETYNIGSDFEITNLDLARYMLKEFKTLDAPHQPLVMNADTIKMDRIEGEERYIEHVNDRPFNDQRYAIGCEKVKALGWRPKVSFEEGLRITKQWYQENADHWWAEDMNRILVPHPFNSDGPPSVPALSPGAVRVKLSLD
ncbi:hypothetical protein HDV05_007503 [Chytridiales sp. JEL 0842]|nr:hypothetical protein HDV05_007503 [Chytridiales sp. JEL 0842]